ncbi:hypothetical protein [Saprospira grandis]|uniref:Transmembrane protein n=1 Tax=Saprospira grandis (strain Lewin) TaxID=984262 RepID=H6L9I4_SAPGL|nr:hypothetical protein [Saprospira grandis]AFC25460.1 hypothetical protein SGRA_2732 [Saprospira grandis str. Lewin]
MFFQTEESSDLSDVLCVSPRFLVLGPFFLPMPSFPRLVDFLFYLLIKLIPLLLALALPLALLYWNWRWTLAYSISSVFILGQIGEWRKLLAYSPSPWLHLALFAAFIGWGFLIYYVPLSPWWTGSLIAAAVLASTYGLDWIKAQPQRYFYYLQSPNVDWELWLDKELNEEDWQEIIGGLREKKWSAPILELQDRFLQQDDLPDALNRVLWQDAKQLFEQEESGILPLERYYHLPTYLHFFLQSPYFIDGLCASIQAPTDNQLFESLIAKCNDLLAQTLAEEPLNINSRLSSYLDPQALYAYFDSWPQLSPHTPKLALLLEDFKAQLLLLAIQYQAIKEEEED